MADVETNVEEMIFEEDSNSVASLQKMKVPELRKLLKDRGLPSLGSKAALLSRLQKALSPDAATGEDSEAIEDEAEDEDVDEDGSDDDGETVITEEQGTKEDDAPPKNVNDLKKKKIPVTNEENSETSKENESLADVVVNMDQPETEEKKATSPTITTTTTTTTAATPITSVISPPSSETHVIETPEKANAGTTKPTLTSDEKLRQRAERFGITSDNDKKAARAARFGTVTTNLSNKPSAKIAPIPVTAEDIDRLKKRAERFGTVVSSTLSKLEDEDKLRKRKQRFGQITGPSSKATSSINTTTTPSIDTTAVTKNTDEVEEKKRKRAERFGLS